MGKQKDMPPLRMAGQDQRAMMYRAIVNVHQEIRECAHKAQIAGVQPGLNAKQIVQILLHCEASIAFLAEELLKLGAMVESGPEIET